MKTLSERTVIGRNDSLNELVYLRATADAFVRTLFNKSFKVTYHSQDDFAGATDAKGNIVLDGRVSEDASLSVFQRADVLKGVLLDEVGHNLYPPHPPYKVEGLWRRYSEGRNPQLYYAGKAMLHSVHNLVEDVHNVWAVTRKFPGFRPLHNRAVEYYIGDADERIARYEEMVASGERPDYDTLFGALIIGAKGERAIDEPGLEEIRQTLLKKAGRREMSPAFRGKLAGELVDAILGLMQDLDDLATDDGSDGGQGDDEQENEGGAEVGQGCGGGEPEGDQDAQDSGGIAGQGTDEDDDSQQDAGASGAGDDDGESDDENAASGGNAGDSDADDSPVPLATKLLEELENLDEALRGGGIAKAAPVSVAPSGDVEMEATEIQMNTDENGLGVEVTFNLRVPDRGYGGQGHIHPQATQLASVLRRQTKFQAISAEERYTGLRRGKLASRDAWKVATGASTCPFSGKTVRDKPKVNLAVVVDASTSMSQSDRWPKSMQVLDILDKAFGNMDGVRFWGLDYSYRTTRDADGRSSPKVQIHVLRQPNTRYKVDLRKVFESGWTPTLPALKEASKLLPLDGQRILVLITDGDPTIGGENDAVRAWVTENPDIRVVQVVLGYEGADIPHTIRVSDYEANRTEKVIAKIGLLIGQALR